MAEPGRGRATALVLLIGAGMVAVGVATTLLGGWQPGVRGQGHDVMPWVVLLPLYLVSAQLTVDFEFRREARSIGLSQLPLAAGLVFVPPPLHLAARLVASVVDSIALRRLPPVKVLFNAGSDALDVGLATCAVVLLRREVSPGPRLWAALLLGLLASDLFSHACFAAVMRVMGVAVPRDQLRQGLAFSFVSSMLFAGLSVVAVTSLWTDPSTAVVILLLFAGLLLAYRGHRRLSVQQRATEALYEFVKDLGPLDVHSPQLRAVLEQIRVLLHARHLDLAVSTGPTGTWRHVAVCDGESPAPEALSRVAQQVALTGTPATPTEKDDRMATPLLGMSGLTGVLTVTDRLGSTRRFDMGDLRLLETVASELSTALERGKLLTDLGVAATIDSLTGLPNLREVGRRLDLAMGPASGGLLVGAVSVDSFREVNDTLGHQVGDELLIEVTRRLHAGYPRALVGRIGGGHFVVAVPAGAVGGDAALFGLGLRSGIEGSAQLGAVGTHIRLSVGCAVAPEHGRDAATVLRRAETAMYSAKDVHGGPVVWEPAYEVQGQRRLAVVMALREALAVGAIGVAFQPKVCSRTGQVRGVEALARWTHPALGLLGPDEFVPLAEAAGLMRPLTTTILRQSLSAVGAWHRGSSAPPIGVAVNVSADTVLDPSFVTEVIAILGEIGTDPQLLTLELTEGVVVQDPVLAVERMSELRAYGVQLSVDDFGTGYSSLTYLKGLPVHEVKIDKGFVDNVTEDRGDQAVVRAVVDIAHTLGLRVVAEGVEQEDQHRALCELGVDELQGFLHARPMVAADMSSWLRARRSRI